MVAEKRTTEPLETLHRNFGSLLVAVCSLDAVGGTRRIDRSQELLDEPALEASELAARE